MSVEAVSAQFDALPFLFGGVAYGAQNSSQHDLPFGRKDIG